jgi:hypothetical protein
VLDLLDAPPGRQTSRNLDMLTVILLTLLTIVAIFVTDLGLINAVGGGSLATIIVFIVPTFMFHAVAQERGPAQAPDVHLAVSLCFFGVVLGVVGVFIAVREG